MQFTVSARRTTSCAGAGSAAPLDPERRSGRDLRSGVDLLLADLEQAKLAATRATRARLVRRRRARATFRRRSEGRSGSVTAASARSSGPRALHASAGSWSSTTCGRTPTVGHTVVEQPRDQVPGAQRVRGGAILWESPAAAGAGESTWLRRRNPVRTGFDVRRPPASRWTPRERPGARPTKSLWKLPEPMDAKARVHRSLENCRTVFHSYHRHSFPAAFQHGLVVIAVPGIASAEQPEQRRPRRGDTALVRLGDVVRGASRPVGEAAQCAPSGIGDWSGCSEPSGRFDSVRRERPSWEVAHES